MDGLGLVISGAEELLEVAHIEDGLILEQVGIIGDAE